MSHSTEIREPTDAEVKLFYGGAKYPFIKDIQAAFVDGKPIGMAGILTDPTHFGTFFEDTGRSIGFMDVDPMAPPLGVRSIIAIKRYLEQKCEAVYVMCDEGTYPTAPRLLRLLGFKATDEMVKDRRKNHDGKLRVYKWQCS